jgi:hypothetical protein
MLSRANAKVQAIFEEGSDGLLDLDTVAEIKAAFPGSRLI